MSAFTYKVQSGDAIEVQLVDDQNNPVVNQPISVQELMERGKAGIQLGNGYTVQLEDISTEEDEEKSSSDASSEASSSDEEEEIEDEVEEEGGARPSRFHEGGMHRMMDAPPPVHLSVTPPPGTEGVRDWYGVMHTLQQEQHTAGRGLPLPSMSESSATPLQVVDRPPLVTTGMAGGPEATTVESEEAREEIATRKANKRSAVARRALWASLAPDKVSKTGPGTGKSGSLMAATSRTFHVLQFVSVMRHLSTRQFRPSALSMHATTTYTHPKDKGQRILVYGGIAGGGKVVEQEVYEFSLLSCTWKRLEGRNFVPAGHFGHTLTATPLAFYRVVVVGGIGPGGLPVDFSTISQDPLKVTRLDALFYLAKLDDSRVVRAPSLTRSMGASSSSVASRIGFVPFVFDMHVQRLEWRAIQLAHPLAIAFHTTISYERELFIFGGVTREGEVSNQLLAMDVDTFGVRVITTPMNIEEDETDAHRSSSSEHSSMNDTHSAASSSGSSLAPAGRFLHTAVRYGHYFIIHGGFDEENKPLRDTWAFDMIRERWERLPIAEEQASPARAGHSAVVVGHRMLLIGGYHCPLGDCLAQGLEKGKRTRVMELNLIPSIETKSGKGHPHRSGESSSSSPSSSATITSTQSCVHHWRPIRTQPMLPPLAFSSCESCGDHFSFFLFGGLLEPPSMGKRKGEAKKENKRKKSVSSSSGSSSESEDSDSSRSGSDLSSSGSSGKDDKMEEEERNESQITEPSEAALRPEKSLSVQLVTLDDAIILRFPLKSEEKKNTGTSSSSAGGEADLSVPPQFKPFVKRQEDFLKKKYFNIDETMRKITMEEKEAMEPPFYLKPEEIEILIEKGEALCEVLTSYPISELPLQLPDRAQRVRITENIISLGRQNRDILKSMKASEAGITAVKSKTHRQRGGQKLVDYAAAKPFRRFVVTEFLHEMEGNLKELKVLNKSLHDVVWEEKEEYLASVVEMKQGIDHLSKTIARIMSRYVNSRVRKLVKGVERHQEVMKKLTAIVEKNEHDKIWGVQEARDQRRIAAGGGEGRGAPPRFVHPGPGRGMRDPPLPLPPPPRRTRSASHRSRSMHVDRNMMDRKPNRTDEDEERGSLSSPSSSFQGIVTRLTEKDCETIRRYVLQSKQCSKKLRTHCRQGVEQYAHVLKDIEAREPPRVSPVEGGGGGDGELAVGSGGRGIGVPPVVLLPTVSALPTISPLTDGAAPPPPIPPTPPTAFLAVTSTLAVGASLPQDHARTAPLLSSYQKETIQASNALREEVMACSKQAVKVLHTFSSALHLQELGKGRGNTQDMDSFTSSSSSSFSRSSTDSQCSSRSFSSNETRSTLRPDSLNASSRRDSLTPHTPSHVDPPPPCGCLSDPLGSKAMHTCFPTPPTASPETRSEEKSALPTTATEALPSSGTPSSVHRTVASSMSSDGARPLSAYREVSLRVVEPLVKEKERLQRMVKKAQRIRVNDWDTNDLGGAPMDAKVATLAVRLEKNFTAIIQFFTASFLSAKGARPPNEKVAVDDRPPIRHSRHRSPPPSLTTTAMRSPRMASKPSHQRMPLPFSPTRRPSCRMSPPKQDPVLKDAIIAHREAMMAATGVEHHNEEKGMQDPHSDAGGEVVREPERLPKALPPLPRQALHPAAGASARTAQIACTSNHKRVHVMGDRLPGTATAGDTPPCGIGARVREEATGEKQASGVTTSRTVERPLATEQGGDGVGVPPDGVGSPPPTSPSPPPIVVPVATFQPLHVVPAPPVPVSASSAAGPCTAATPIPESEHRSPTGGSLLSSSEGETPSVGQTTISDPSVPAMPMTITPVYPMVGGEGSGMGRLAGCGTASGMVYPFAGEIGIPPSGWPPTWAVATPYGMTSTPMAVPSVYVSPPSIPMPNGASVTASPSPSWPTPAPPTTGIHVTPSGGVRVQPPPIWPTPISSSPFAVPWGSSPTLLSGAAHDVAGKAPRTMAEPHAAPAVTDDSRSTMGAPPTPVVSFGPSTFVVPGKGTPSKFMGFPFPTSSTASPPTAPGVPSSSLSGIPPYAMGSNGPYDAAPLAPRAETVQPPTLSSTVVDQDYFYFGQPGALRTAFPASSPSSETKGAAASAGVSSRLPMSSSSTPITTLPSRGVSAPLGTTMYRPGVVPNTPRVAARQRSTSRPRTSHASTTTAAAKGKSGVPNTAGATALSHRVRPQGTTSSSHRYETRIAGRSSRDRIALTAAFATDVEYGKPRVVKSNMTIGERRILEARERLRGKP